MYVRVCVCVRVWHILYNWKILMELNFETFEDPMSLLKIKIPKNIKSLLSTVLNVLESLSTVVLNSRDRQGMYGMQHFRAPINKPHNSL